MKNPRKLRLAVRLARLVKGRAKGKRNQQLSKLPLPVVVEAPSEEEALVDQEKSEDELAKTDVLLQERSHDPNNRNHEEQRDVEVRDGPSTDKELNELVSKGERKERVSCGKPETDDPCSEKGRTWLTSVRAYHHSFAEDEDNEVLARRPGIDRSFTDPGSVNAYSSLQYSSLGQSSDSNMSERQIRARELKQRVKKIVDIARQRTASLSNSSVESSQNSSKRSCASVSHLGEENGEEHDEDVTIPKLLFLPNVEPTGSTGILPTEDGHCDATHSSVCSSEATSESGILEDDSQLSQAYSSYGHSFSFAHSQQGFSEYSGVGSSFATSRQEQSFDGSETQISMQISNWWLDGTSNSVVSYDPRCCDPVLVMDERLRFSDTIDAVGNELKDRIQHKHSSTAKIVAPSASIDQEHDESVLPDKIPKATSAFWEWIASSTKLN